MSAKIYVSYFNDACRVESNILTPLQVGRALTKNPLNMIGDDTGENISTRNPTYCELTGHYWAWKNDRTSSHIGFMHYRRLLDFRFEHSRPETTIHGVIEDALTPSTMHKFGLNDEEISDALKGYDLLIPNPFDVRTVGYDSVEQQYRLSPGHRKSDFDAMRSAVAKISPDYLEHFEKMASGGHLYPANVFVASRPIFEKYAEWVFPILEAVEENIDLEDRDAVERRVTGYLAERLTTAFILKMLDELPASRIRRTSLVFVKDTAPGPIASPKPQTELGVVTLVASSDQAYVPHLGALVVSVLANASHNRFIDFLILDGGIDKISRTQLGKLSDHHPHCRISFIDMTQQFLDVEVHSYFARSTFYRLALPSLLRDRDRVLFLDTDMVVVADVCDLYDTDMEGKLAAVTRDLVMTSFRSMGVRSIAETNGATADAYLADHLKMGSRNNEYFQAGVILFDLRQLRKYEVATAMIIDLRHEKYWFLDQDVLNKHFVGKVKFVDGRWNVLYMDEMHRGALRNADVKIYESAIEDPYIVHYAGIAKPWHNTINPHGGFYWKYLRTTVWYEKTLFEFLERSPIERRAQPLQPSNTRALIAALWRISPTPIRKILFPIARRMATRIT